MYKKTMKILNLIIALLILGFSACSQEKTPEVSTGTLIFQSGFEPDSKVVAKGSEADIIGVDRSFADHNDWVKWIGQSPGYWQF